MANVTRGTLRQRPIVALVFSQLVSVMGTLMSVVAIPWFVLTTTGSATRMGIVLAAEFGAAALFGLPGGAIAGRLGARRTLLVADACRAPLLAAIPVLHWTGTLTFPVLVALVVAAGAFYVPYVACQQAILPDLVGEDEHLLGRANALLMIGERSAALIGPAIAAALIAGVGAPVVLAIDAATFLVSLALVSLLVPRGAGRALPEPPGRVLAGARFLAREPLLARWTVSAGGFEAGWQIVIAALPVLAVTRFDGDARVVGLALGALGLGAVIGSLVAVRLLGRVDSIRLAVVAKAIQVAVLWVLVATLPVLALAGVMLVAGAMTGLVNAPVTAVRTVRTPASLRPATGAAFVTVMLLVGAIGLGSAGPILDANGAQAAFLVAAIVQTVFTVPFALAGLRSARGGLAPVLVREPA